MRSPDSRAAVIRGVAGLLVGAFLSQACATANSARDQQTRIEAEIRHSIEEQSAAWNRGDIRGFMEGYQNSPSITFLSGVRLQRGFEPVLEGYLQRYPPGKQGTLAFEPVEIVPLSNDAAYVISRYALGGEIQQKGMFTIVLRRIGGRWLIVHDHTSAEAGE